MIEDMLDNNEGRTNETKLIKSGIEVITGNTNILLIALYKGKTEPYDDIGTAELTRNIADYLGCYAVIDTYSCMDEALSAEQSIKELNDLVASIRAVGDTDGLTYMFWIYGIKDENIKSDNAQCLISYGQNDEQFLTANKETVGELIKALNNYGIVTRKAATYKIIDVGVKDETMNYQRIVLDEYSLERVQSVQLDFKLTGCRDNEHNLELTAKAVAKAINEVININKDNTMITEENTQNEPQDEVNTAQINDVKIDVVDNEPSTALINSSDNVSDYSSDDVIVDKAYNELKKIFLDEFQKAEQSALLRSGRYLIKIFYDNDYVSAANKQFTKTNSLNKLFAKIEKEADANSPKKTWLYNSINLAVADKKYQQYKELSDDSKKVEVLSAWNEKLTVSHKIKLIHTKGLTEQQMDDLIIETAKQNYKVLDLRERIGEIKEKIPKEKQSPFQKFKISLDNRFSEDTLNKFDAAQLKELKKALKYIIKNITAKLDSKKEATPIKPEEPLEAQTDEHNIDEE